MREEDHSPQTHLLGMHVPAFVHLTFFMNAYPHMHSKHVSKQ